MSDGEVESDDEPTANIANVKGNGLLAMMACYASESEDEIPEGLFIHFYFLIITISRISVINSFLYFSKTNKKSSFRRRNK